jgi:hypothetical protein
LNVPGLASWTDGGWVFATPTGGPLNPRTDYTEWKRLLKAAGLRDGRLHDARHTAATVLLVLEIAERAVMGIMGWSDSGMAKRYQHLTAQVRRDVAERVGGLLWQLPAEVPGGPDHGAASVRVPATETETGQRNARRLTKSRRAFDLFTSGGEGI